MQKLVFCPLMAVTLSLVACQMPSAKLDSSLSQTALVNQQARQPSVPELDPVSPLAERVSGLKSSASGRVNLHNQTLTLSLQLPPLPDQTPGFQTKRLDLTSAQQIRATVKDFYGHTVLPQGADSKGLITYPADGVLRLNFNQVVSAPLIFVELEVLENGVAIPQAELSTVFTSTPGVPFPGVDFNFQTSAVARVMKALLSSEPKRARALELPALESLVRTITGVSGTAPSLSYTSHPSLVDSELLATHLQTRQPAELNPTDYRRTGASIALTVVGLLGTDRLQAQVTDAATAVIPNLANGASTVLAVTPGGPLKVKGSDFGTPVMSYTYSASPAQFVTSNGQPQAVTLTATPTFMVTSVVPNAARTGSTVILNGNNLTGTTAVRFNGVNASFTVDSPTQISAVVPANATDGVITVVNRGTWTTPSFDVYRTWYVNNSSPGTQNGLSWATPYHDLQAALTSSGAFDEIWLATGTYKPAAAGGNTGASFLMKPRVDIYGGFSGNETLRSDRDPATRLVTLSGDLNGNDDYTVEPFAHLSDNSLRVIRGADNAILDGVTVQGGGQGTTEAGGMYNRFTSPTVNNVTFRNNTSTFGAGLYNTGQIVSGVVIPSVPVLSNLRFIDNRSTISGGGMYNNLVVGATYSNLSFSGNRAAGAATNRGGGGMASGQSSFTVNNASFSNNQAPAGTGGGMVNLDFSTTILNDVSFSNNSAGNTGGGLSIRDNSGGTLNRVTFTGNTATTQGGGMSIISSSSGTLNTVTFNSNTAVSQGGGVMMGSGTTGSFDQVSFISNSVTGPNSPGGGIAINGSTVSMTSSRLIGNTASGTGTHNGLGLQAINSATVTLSNVLFANHIVTSGSSQGGGLHCNNNSIVRLYNASFANNQATTGGGGIHIVAGGNLTMQNALFWQSSQVGATVGSQGNFSVGTDPFVNSGAPASDGLRLAAPATGLLDMGVNGTDIPLTDILGNARVNLPEPGAYEFF